MMQNAATSIHECSLRHSQVRLQLSGTAPTLHLMLWNRIVLMKDLLGNILCSPKRHSLMQQWHTNTAEMGLACTISEVQYQVSQKMFWENALLEEPQLVQSSVSQTRSWPTSGSWPDCFWVMKVKVTADKEIVLNHLESETEPNVCLLLSRQMGLSPTSMEWNGAIPGTGEILCGIQDHLEYKWIISNG